MPSVPAWYEDMPFTCRACGRDEIWTARQQHWWYEVAQGPIESTARLCRPCRNAKRDANEETTARVRASRALRARRKALALVAALHARGVDVPAMLATPTDALSLPTSMRECLDENGLTTLGAVVALNTSELPRGFSPTLLRRLSTELAKLGLAIVGCRVEEA